MRDAQCLSLAFPEDPRRPQGAWGLCELEGHFCGWKEGGLEAPQLCPASCPQLQELHRAGGDLMHRDERSRTLLHHAVSTGSKEVVRYLLDHGELCPGGSQGWGEAAGPL